MPEQVSLDWFLLMWAGDNASRADVSLAVARLSEAGRDISENLSCAGFATDRLIEAARNASVAVLTSREMDTPVVLRSVASLAIAVDALPGYDKIESHGPIGTIFSIWPHCTGPDDSSFLVKGRRQLAAAYFLYGANTTLVLTLGSGTHVFRLDRKTRRFMCTRRSIYIPPTGQEIAIDMSKYRHLNSGLTAYINDRLSGTDGPMHSDCAVRWTASLIADAHQIITRGGIYLHPAGTQSNQTSGCPLLVYEASPIALLIQQAGGAARDPMTDILELEPVDLHQRTGLAFGSQSEMERMGNYISSTMPNEKPPLFAHRGLFRS